MKNIIFSFLSHKVVPNIGMILVTVITTATTSVAAYKLSQTMPLENQTIDQISSGITKNNNDTSKQEKETDAQTEVKTVDTNTNPAPNLTDSQNNTAPSSPKVITLPVNNNSTSNRCLITLFGKQYDVTTLRNIHSGGDIFTCNTDMSTIYSNQHGSNVSRMAQYLVINNANSTVSQTPTQTNTNNNNTNPQQIFTTKTLAIHNKANDCYISYNGIVYDVSSVPEWNSCSHHGITGGQDITSRFPHPTSYLSTLPIVGKMEITTTNSGTSIQQNNNENEPKDSHEDEPKLEDDNSLNINILQELQKYLFRVIG